ncbi:E1-E2 ATPase-domain-containing protein [Infundibulicybe gibba]|nr:E1-E2 ATPase-domain-containing protein [Infundibulicybe gibba]
MATPYTQDAEKILGSESSFAHIQDGPRESGSDNHSRKGTDYARSRMSGRAVVNLGVELPGEFRTLGLPVAELCVRLGVSETSGLSADIAARRLSRDGKNVISPPPNNLAKKIFWYIFGGFGGLLFLGSILCFIAWRPLGNPNSSIANLALGVVPLIVISIQAFFNAWHVTRDGFTSRIPAADLVSGDIVTITLGSKVPADIRLIDVSSDLRFDRSILTGESNTVPASLDCTDDNFMESRNIALQGTLYTNGNGKGICVGLGDNTVFGRIAKQIGASRPNDTRDGLPVCVTLSLTVIAGEMRKSNVLCKSLSTVEGLGAVDVIASDKTGTLTRNKIVVANLSIGMTQFPTEKLTNDVASHSTTEALAAISGLCTDALFESSDTSQSAPEDRVVHGDASMLRVYMDRDGAIAFNSKNKFSVKIFRSNQYDSNPTPSPILSSDNFVPSDMFLLAKGADILSRRCTHYTDPDGQTHELDTQALANITRIQEGFANQEQPETIRVCCRAGIRFAMVTALLDGFTLTAAAVARQVGIIATPPQRLKCLSDLPADLPLDSITPYDAGKDPHAPLTSLVLSGQEMMAMTDSQWKQALA